MLREASDFTALVAVVRAAPGDLEAVVEDLADDAAESGIEAVIPGSTGAREILYGVSVWGYRSEEELRGLLAARFPNEPSILIFDPLVLGDAGFPVLPTGSNEMHFDVQLVSGRTGEEAGHEATPDELRAAAERLVALRRELRDNPAYPGV
ncbi:MAG: hypothetical protein ACRDZR_00025 [Acidimicrobiales bacterium]